MLPAQVKAGELDKCNIVEEGRECLPISAESIRDLPALVVIKIFRFLSARDLLNITETCHTLRSYAEDNSLWKEKCKKGNVEYSLTSMDETLLRHRNTMNSSFWKTNFIKNIVEKNFRKNPINHFPILDLSDNRPAPPNRPVMTNMQFVGEKLIAICGCSVKVLDPLNGICLGTLDGHIDTVSTIAVETPFIVSGSLDNSLKVWNWVTFQCIKTLRGHTNQVWCTSLNEGILVSGSFDCTVRLWNVTDGTSCKVFKGHKYPVRSVQFNGTVVVSGSDDRTVKIWNIEGECVRTFVSHNGLIISVMFSGVNVVSTSWDSTIRVWDLEAGTGRYKLQRYAPFENGDGYFDDVIEIHDTLMVSAHKYRNFKIWDTRTWNCLPMLDDGNNTHGEDIVALDFNTKFVVTGSLDGMVKLWDIKTGAFIRDLLLLEEGRVKKIRMKEAIVVCLIIRKKGQRMNGPAEIRVLNFDF